MIRAARRPVSGRRHPAGRGFHGERGALSIALAVTIAVVGGAGVGVALEQGGAFGSHGETSIVGLDAVNVFDCPAGTVRGQLHRGDRVFATGRQKGGDTEPSVGEGSVELRPSSSTWIEIRDPSALANRIWIDASYLVPDSDLAELPVHDCATTTTTTTAEAGSADPGVTTTTAGGGSAGTTPVGGGAPAPAVPPSDTTGPTITGVSSVFNPIFEVGPVSTTKCDTGGQQGQSIVSAAVSDPSGVASVTMAWSVAATNGSKSMTSGNGVNYNSVLGTFPQSTISNTPGTASITVTITARDVVGNIRTAAIGVTLGNCGLI